MRTVSHRKIRLVITRHGLLASQHHAGLWSVPTNVLGENLVHADPGLDTCALLQRHPGKKVTGLCRVNAYTNRRLVEEAVDDVDLFLQRLQRLQSLAQLEVRARSLSPPMIPVDSVAHEHNGKALGKRSRGAGFSSANRQRFQPWQGHGDSSAIKKGSTGRCFAHRVSSYSGRWLASRSRRQKLHTYRRRTSRENSGWLQSAISRIDSARQNGVGILISNRKIFRRWLDSEMTRGFSPGPLLFNVGERTFAGIDAEEHHCIVPAIGGIQVFS